ncbi:MAG: thioredoxin family protein [Nodosilinea sp.]
MLKNCIADYAPATVPTPFLQPDEVLHHSFAVTLAQKQGLGYQLQTGMEFYSHLTSQRLILQPIESAPVAQVQTFPLDQIYGFRMVRAFLLTPFAEVSLKPTDGSQPRDLAFAVRVCPGRTLKANQSNRAEDFVQLGNGLLEAGGAGATSPDLQAALAFDGLVLLDFWMPGCRPCAELETVLESLLDTYGGQVKLVKVNVDESQEVAQRYGVDCFPTVLLLKSGVVVNQIVGAIPKSIVAKIIERHVQPVFVA